MAEQFSQRLEEIWQQGGREYVITFLRRAIHPNATLAEVQSALSFTGVAEHLEDICLQDIFTPSNLEQPPAATHTQSEHVIGRPTHARRSRRTPEEMQQMRSLLVKFLEDEPGTLNTVQLVEMLAESGHTVDTIIVNTLLKGLEQAGTIKNFGGKPKTWRKVSHGGAYSTLQPMDHSTQDSN